jgi:hypothetical protein
LTEQGIHLLGVGHVGANRHRPAARVLNGLHDLVG